MPYSNHIQLTENVYCRLLSNIVPLSEEHFDKNCTSKCPYFNGIAQGDGIECKFEDPKGGLYIVDTEEGVEELARQMAGAGSVYKELSGFVKSWKGGAGSGHHGHAGVTGRVGGSAPGPGLLAVAASEGGKLAGAGTYKVLYTSPAKRVTDKKAKEAGPGYISIRVGGKYHVVDIGTGPVKTVGIDDKTAAKFGIPAGTAISVYSVPTNKKAAERKAEKLGKGYVAVRAEGAYHVVETGWATAVRSAKGAADIRGEPTPTAKKGRGRRRSVEERTADIIASGGVVGEGYSKIPKEFRHSQFAAIPENKKTKANFLKEMRGSYSPDHIREREAEFKAMVKDQPVRMGVTKKAIMNIAQGDTFRNQHSTGTSHGYLGPEGRARAEKNVFGDYQKGPEDYPVYGFVGPNGEAYKGMYGGAGKRHIGYGDGIVVTFRNKVKTRTTITLGDSLHNFGAGQIIPTPLLDAKAEGTDFSTMSGKGGRTMSAAGRGWFSTHNSYIEAQIHGKTTKDDIYSVTFSAYSARDNRDAIEALEKAGIKVEIER